MDRPDILVEPFHCYVEFNGWPAGVTDPHGAVFAAGTAANVEAFIDALKAATAALRPPLAEGDGS